MILIDLEELTLIPALSQLVTSNIRCREDYRKARRRFSELCYLLKSFLSLHCLAN